MYGCFRHAYAYYIYTLHYTPHTCTALGHALVTAVISLSDYGSEYRGGLYVATGRSANKVVALRRGDAVVHQSDLLHGVKVRCIRVPAAAVI